MDLTNKILDLWRFLKGSLHFRFSILICYLGASFMFPQLWEFIFYYAIEIYKSIFNPELKSYEIGNDPVGLIDYIVGISLIISGIVIFVYFQKKEFKDSVNLISVLGLWSNIHNLSDDPEKFNVDDVIKAVSVINETSNLLVNAKDKVIREFYRLRGEDYTIIYNKLLKNNYNYNGKQYRDDLKSESHDFFELLKPYINE